MLYEVFIEPWTLGDWFWRGMLTAVLAAVPCAVLGVFLYLRRQSLISDALAHVALPGVVFAFLWTGSMEPLPMLLGAAVVGLGSSVLIQQLGSTPGVREDAAVGIVFTAMFALGVVALSMFVHDAHLDTHCVLFGDVLGVSDGTLWTLGIVAPGVCVAVYAGWRWLVVVSFDEVFARNIGVPLAAVHYALMGAVSATTVASFEAVGAILSVAMIVVPAAFAHILADRLEGMIAWAVAHGVVSAAGGMYASVTWDVSSAGAIVVVGGALYAAAFMLAPRHGVLTRWMRRHTARAAGGSEGEGLRSASGAGS